MPTLPTHRLIAPRALAPGLVVGLIALTSLAGCSAQQLHDSGQAWQRQQCQALQDADQRQRCLADAARRHDEYQRGVQAAREVR